MANAELFWNLMAKSYAKKPVPDETLYQKKLQATQSWLTKEMKVLEFGCGTGSTALIHAPHVHHYLAIDSSEKMVAIAKRKCAQASLDNLEIQKSSFDDFDAPAESFDVILGLSILHLLKSPEGAIEKVSKLLKPGGFFVSSTACLAGGSVWFQKLMQAFGALGVIPSVRFLSRSGLEEQIVSRGFTKIFELPEESSPQVAFFIHQKLRDSAT